MKLLDRLERQLRPYAVPHITLGLIGLQVVIYFLQLSNPGILENCVLDAVKVRQGEVWRVISFLFLPPSTILLFAFFWWYLFYLMGSALETQWGTLRYNLFLAVGWAATVAVVLIASFAGVTPPATNVYLLSTVFLAFAQLYPDFTLQLYFVLPVKIKWLAWLTWAAYTWQFLTGSWFDQVLIAASVANFFLFFGNAIYRQLIRGQRRVARQAAQTQERSRPRHRCSVCGITNLVDPKMEFRYCSKCAGNPCYCSVHLSTHEHVASVDADSTSQRR